MELEQAQRHAAKQRAEQRDQQPEHAERRAGPARRRSPATQGGDGEHDGDQSGLAHASFSSRSGAGRPTTRVRVDHPPRPAWEKRDKDTRPGRGQAGTPVLDVNIRVLANGAERGPDPRVTGPGQPQASGEREDNRLWRGPYVPHSLSASSEPRPPAYRRATWAERLASPGPPR